MESEVEVFFSGLERGAATIKQLSDDTKLGRITVHEIVKRLVKKGLFLETYSKKKRLVYPNQMDSLTNLVATKKLEVQALEQQAIQATALLRSIASQSENLPKTRFYKGKEGIQLVMNEIKQDRSNVNIMSDAQHFGDLIDNNLLESTLEIRKRYRIHTRLIFPTGFEYFAFTHGTIKQSLEMRSLPASGYVQWGITLRGNKIAFHCYEGRFITTTIIENKQIHQIMTYLFEQLRVNGKA
jgi:predicted transcriptional regulator